MMIQLPPIGAAPVYMPHHFVSQSGAEVTETPVVCKDRDGMPFVGTWYVTVTGTEAEVKAAVREYYFAHPPGRCSTFFGLCLEVTPGRWVATGSRS